MVVDCEKDTLREHCYWPIVSDLINVLSHKPVAQAFLKNDTLLDFWFGLVGYFQGKKLHVKKKKKIPTQQGENSLLDQ